jgi:hypothetical protein
VIVSLAPAEYMSAVSNRVIPASTARRTIGSALSSGRNHATAPGSP